MERRSGSRPQHILIADDSDDLREMWCVWLTFWEFTVEEARNGAEALAKAEARRPDLVLMDLWMPVVNGFDATARLRGIPSTADVPVVGMSASPDPPTPERALAAGCDLFLPKPVTPDVLLEHLRTAFHRFPPRVAARTR